MVTTRDFCLLFSQHVEAGGCANALAVNSLHPLKPQCGILIIGAGLGGLVTAIGMRNAAHGVTIIERALPKQRLHRTKLTAKDRGWHPASTERLKRSPSVRPSRRSPVRLNGIQGDYFALLSRRCRAL